MRLTLLKYFPAPDTGYMFSRAWHWWHHWYVLFPALDAGYTFPRASQRFDVSRAWLRHYVLFECLKFVLDNQECSLCNNENHFVLPIVLSYEATTTASWEAWRVNVCTSSTASKDSFVKSTGTSVGGFTWLGRNPTRDDPRRKRALEPPVWNENQVLTRFLFLKPTVEPLWATTSHKWPRPLFEVTAL